MSFLKRFIPLLLCVWLSACAGPSSHTRHTKWELPKISREYRKWKSPRLGPPARGIMYQGSDSQWHYFTMARRENYVYVKVRKDELRLQEYPYRYTPSGSLGYYYIDPENNFQRVEWGF